MAKEITKEKEIDYGLPLPLEFQAQLSKILIDNPSLTKIGDHEFRVHGLRMYSLEKIHQVAHKLRAFEGKDLMGGMKYICGNIDALCECVAIVLCNHLYDEEHINYDSYEEMMSLMSRNDKITEMVKNKVKLLSKGNINELASIVFSAFAEMEYSELFQFASSVMTYSESFSMRHQKNIEMLSTIRQAGLDKCQTGSKRIQLGKSGTTSTNSPEQK